MSRDEKKGMIKPKDVKISISRQCQLVSLNRSTFYHQPLGTKPETLEMMNKIDKIFTQYPFFGSRQITATLRNQGVTIDRHRVRRYYFYSSERWLPLSRRHHGLGDEESLELAFVKYPAR